MNEGVGFAPQTDSTKTTEGENPQLNASLSQNGSNPRGSHPNYGAGLGPKGKSSEALKQAQKVHDRINEEPEPIDHQALVAELAIFNAKALQDSSKSGLRVYQDPEDNKSYLFYQQEGNTLKPILKASFTSDPALPNLQDASDRTSAENETELMKLWNKVNIKEKEYPEMQQMVTKVYGSYIQKRNNEAAIPQADLGGNDVEQNDPQPSANGKIGNNVTNTLGKDVEVVYTDPARSNSESQGSSNATSGSQILEISPDWDDATVTTNLPNTTEQRPQQAPEQEPPTVEKDDDDPTEPPTDPTQENNPPTETYDETEEDSPTAEELEDLRRQARNFEAVYQKARKELDDAPEKTAGFKNWVRKMRKVIETSTSLAGGFATGFAVKSIVAASMVSAGIATGGVAVPLAAAVIAGAGSGAIKAGIFGGLLHYNVFCREEHHPFTESRKKDKIKLHEKLDTENRMNSLVSVYNRTSGRDLNNSQSLSSETLGLSNEEIPQAYVDYLVMYRLTRFTGVNEYPIGEQGFVKPGDRDLTAAEAIAEMGEILPRLIALNGIEVDSLIEQANNTVAEKYKQIKRIQIGRRVKRGAKVGAIGGYVGAIVGNIIETGQALPSPNTLGISRATLPEPTGSILENSVDGVPDYESIRETAWNTQSELLQNAGIDPNSISVDGLIDSEDEISRLADALAQTGQQSSVDVSEVLNVPSNTNVFQIPEAWKPLAQQDGWSAIESFRTDQSGGAYGVIQGEVTKAFEEAGVTAESFGSENGFKAWTELVKARIAEAGVTPNSEPTGALEQVKNFVGANPLEAEQVESIISTHGLQTVNPSVTASPEQTTGLLEQIREIAENSRAQFANLGSETVTMPAPETITGLTEEESSMLFIPEIRKHLEVGINHSLDLLQQIDAGLPITATIALPTTAAVATETILSGSDLKGAPDIKGRNGLNEFNPVTNVAPNSTPDLTEDPNPTTRPTVTNATDTGTNPPTNPVNNSGSRGSQIPQVTNANGEAEASTGTGSSQSSNQSSTPIPRQNLATQAREDQQYKETSQRILSTSQNREDAKKKIDELNTLINQYRISTLKGDTTPSLRETQLQKVYPQTLESLGLSIAINQSTGQIDPTTWRNIYQQTKDELVLIKKELEHQQNLGPEYLHNYPNWTQYRVELTDIYLELLNNLFTQPLPGQTSQTSTATNTQTNGGNQAPRAAIPVQNLNPNPA